MRSRTTKPPVRSGDVDGRGSLYDSGGNLVGWPEEEFLEIAKGWDMEVSCPWRRVLPKMIFLGFNGHVSSKLYVTTRRIVLIREIDSWRELTGELTPLGIPTAVAKGARLKELKSAGVRQFCEIDPHALKIASSRRFVKRGSMLDLRLVGDDSLRYAITFWKTDGKDDRMLSLLESQFER